MCLDGALLTGCDALGVACYVAFRSGSLVVGVLVGVLAGVVGLVVTLATELRSRAAFVGARRAGRPALAG